MKNLAPQRLHCIQTGQLKSSILMDLHQQNQSLRLAFCLGFSPVKLMTCFVQINNFTKHVASMYVMQSFLCHIASILLLQF